METVCLLIAHRNVVLTPGSPGLLFFLFRKMKSMKSVESHLFKDIMQTTKDVLFREMFVAVLFRKDF